MLRLFLMAGLIMPLTAAAAKPAKSEAPKEPPPAAIAHAEKICTASSAFGRPFTRQAFGHIDAVADEDWAPFEKLTLQPGETLAVASFRGAGDSIEEDEARATKFWKALEKAVIAEGKFPHHDKHDTGAAFRTGKEPGQGRLFDIRQNGDLVEAVCVRSTD